jgi:hypothetical protein
MACETAISEGTARGFYDRLLETRGADDCTLEEVATDKTQMTVLWKVHGRALPVAEIVHKDCAAADALVGPTLAMRVPDPLRTACPATIQAAVAIVQKESFDVPYSATGDKWRPVGVGAAGVAVATILFTVVMVLRHRGNVAPPAVR